MRFYLQSMLTLFWNLFFGTGLDTSTRKEIKKLKRNNKVFQQIKTPIFLQLFLFLINNWWIFLILSLISFCPEIFKCILNFTNLFPNSTIPAFFWNSEYKFKELFGLIAAIQATMIGIFIPLSITVISLLFKSSEVKDEILEALNMETALKGLVWSSAFLLGWTTILYFLNQSTIMMYVSFFIGLSTVFWFILNICAVLRFTIVGLNFISPSKRSYYLKKYIANEIYPQEIHQSLKEYKYLTLAESSDENSLRSKFIELGLPWKDQGTNEVTTALKGSYELLDVKLGLLNCIIDQWLRRVKDSGLIQNDSCLLIFPLSPNEIYEGEVTLCQIRGEVRLTCFEKWLVKRCFKFKKAKDKKSTSRSLSIYTKSAFEGINNSDTDQFRFFLNEQIEVHTSLLALGENDLSNYGELHSSTNYFQSLQQEWSNSYHKIFELSVAELNLNDFFFRNCSYIGVRLAFEILKTTSYVGLNSSISNQGYLWFRLNEWWEGNCEKQGKQLHNLEAPQKLGLPEGKTYNEAMTNFIGGWEELQRTLVRHRKKVIWEDYRKLFKGLRQHLEYTILCLSKSVLSGNEDAAIKWLDHLLRWNAINVDSQDNADFFRLQQQILLTPDLLDNSWKATQEKLGELNCLDKPIEETQVFFAILQHYWQDACHTLTCFLLHWSMQTNTPEVTLSTDALIRLLMAETEDNSDIIGKSKFVESFDEYLISFLRRHSSSYFDKDAYAGILENLANNIKNLTSSEMVSGRGYTTCGFVMDEIAEVDFEIALFLANPKTEINPKLFEALRSVLNTKNANSLKYILEKEPTKLSRNKIESIFKKYYERKGEKSERYTKHLKYSLKQFAKLKEEVDSWLLQNSIQTL